MKSFSYSQIKNLYQNLTEKHSGPNKIKRLWWSLSGRDQKTADFWTDSEDISSDSIRIWSEFPLESDQNLISYATTEAEKAFTLVNVVAVGKTESCSWGNEALTFCTRRSR